MTISLNRVQLLGHLGADPEIRTASNGREVARLNIATNERFTDKSGEKQERTEWHRVVIFQGNLIKKVVIPYLSKGSRVLIEGSLRTDKYTDKNGVERFSTDIVLRELSPMDRPPQESGK